ncbi:hypothetical protein K438DRAFT_1621972 [Mycena galopus ATCC 62051]|nr:hypothetical protein K438DRAFT_1621972 [Mycena galopus ATCC 62051]
MCGKNEAIELSRSRPWGSNAWQPFSGCSQILDLQQGYYHMTCRCRTEFCYVCTARWKPFSCSQWERRFLNIAEQWLRMRL